MDFQEIKTTFKVGTKPWMEKADVSFVLFFDCNNEVMNIFICPHGLQAIDCQLLEKNGKFTFSVGSNIYI